MMEWVVGRDRGSRQSGRHFERLCVVAHAVVTRTVVARTVVAQAVVARAVVV